MKLEVIVANLLNDLCCISDIICNMTQMVVDNGLTEGVELVALFTRSTSALMRAQRAMKTRDRLRLILY